jgi:HD-GYP domain-containing protein (c-di-GMP phosphodiesterase class II)
MTIHPQNAPAAPFIVAPSLPQLGKRGEGEIFAEPRERKVVAISWQNAEVTDPVTVSPDEVERLRQMLEQAREESQKLAETLAESWDELTLLYNLAEGLRGVLEVDQALQFALEQARAVLSVEGVAVLMRDETGGWQVRVALCPSGREEWLQGQLGWSVAVEAIQRRKGFILNDLWGHPQWGEAAKTFAVQNLVAVPFNPEGHAQGVLIAWNNLARDGFTSGELKLLSTIVAQTSGVIESAYLFQQLRQSFQGFISSIATAVDAKSRWTAGHSHRVTQYALWLAEKIGLPDEFAEKVRLSGLLHDVGKIGVPDAVLEKPDRLTDDEFAFIKRHPEEGYRILSPIRQLRGDILDGVLYHHERVDGKGYPFGLVGEEIPFMGRLLAVADGFDAMTSDRPYRLGMPKEKALAILTDGAGTQWDRDLALAFVDLMRDRPLLKSEPEEAMS